MERLDTPLQGVCILKPRVFGDARGFFMETWNRRSFEALGISADFVQDNHSLSRQGTLRGLHFQRSRPQGKLVRVTRGEVFDVAVDLRVGSPTRGQWFGTRLSGENRHLLWIPPGFAHGFYTLSEEAELLYKCSDYYDPADESGIAWNDPQLAIDWPLRDGQTPLLSAKDQAAASLAEALASHPPAPPA